MIINDKDKERWWCGISNDITPPTSPIGDATTLLQPSLSSSSHLLELQKEIKEEGDEIFADINSLIANSHTDYDASPTIEYQIQITNSDVNITSATTSGHNNNNTSGNISNNIVCNGSGGSSSSSASSSSCNGTNSQATTTADTSYDHHDDQCYEEEENYDENETEMHLHGSYSNYYGDNHYIDDDMINNHHGLTDDDVDPQQMTNHPLDEDHDDGYVYNDSELAGHLSNLPKPCVFFLEGNCRRSDCKYSHDLSSITCKYWIEGFCFKGEMCPFLHSYLPPAQDQTLSKEDDSGWPEQSRTSEPTFTIESEADFPSLPLDHVPKSNHVNSKPSQKQQIVVEANPAVVFKMVKKKRKRG